MLAIKVTVTDNVNMVTVTEKGDAMKHMRLKEQNGASYLSYNDIYPVMQLNKSYAIISIGGVQKKVMLSTGRYPKAFKNDPVFEMVTVTENQLDLIPKKRPVGRPSTGKALTPAQKQAAYRARLAERAVTVTFERAHIATLKTILANVPDSLGLPRDDVDALAKAVFDAAIR